jgi:hypothetical protein
MFWFCDLCGRRAAFWYDITGDAATTTPRLIASRCERHRGRVYGSERVGQWRDAPAARPASERGDR